MGRQLALLTLALALLPIAVRADDYGPARTVGQIRAEARRLLARQVRASGVDPKEVVISDVVVSGDEALLSWDFTTHHGMMGLARNTDRWWDAWDAKLDGKCWTTTTFYPLGNGGASFPTPHKLPNYEPAPSEGVLVQKGLSRDLAAAAAVHNGDVRASSQKAGSLGANPGCLASLFALDPDLVLHPQGGTVSPPRFQTSGYALKLTYAANDASSARFKQVYFRPPTPAEFLPNHALAPGWGNANAVCFFDIGIDGTPVDVKAGTVVDVWFPFVLDDQLQYSISFFSDDKPSGLIKGTIFDNTVHFVLPEFTLAPGKPLMAEIDGDPMPSH